MEKTLSFSSYINSKYQSIKHSTYFDSYDYFFSNYRGKKITFVEIGVLDGGSLHMWRDYFGPEARIIGIDLNPKAKKWESHGFEIYIGNQSDKMFWESFKAKVENIDIVLDDGGHTYEQQIITTECLLESMADGGILVVEDTHTSYLSGFGPKRKSFINYVKNRIDAVNGRFSELDIMSSERRFWSIEVVESMVAFKIRQAQTAMRSFPTTNNGIMDNSEDYRNTDILGYRFLKRNSKLFRLIYNIPGSALIFQVYKKISMSVKFKAYEFFK
jgi:hypothetical protein